MRKTIYLILTKETIINTHTNIRTAHIKAHSHTFSPSFCSNNTEHHSPYRTRNSTQYICDSVVHDDTKDWANTKYRQHLHEPRTPTPLHSLDISLCLAATDQC